MKTLTQEQVKRLRREYSKWFENVEIDMRNDLKEVLDVDDEYISDEDLEEVMEDFYTAIFPWNSADYQEESEKYLKECGYITD